MRSEHVHINVIAEIGSVHDGSVGNALKLIDAALDAGADAVKFQLHIPHAESLPDAPTPSHFTSEQRVQYLERTAFTRDEWRRIRDHAGDAGLLFYCSPFSIEAVEVLRELQIDGYKVASGELTNLPLLEAIASLGKPIFLSTGMSNWDEIDQAYRTVRNPDQITIMQCSSTYPCPPALVGLNVIVELQTRYQCPIGFSDHTLGNVAALAAVTLGATTIEKHITFSRLMYGSDAFFSTEPHEFSSLVRDIRILEDMLAADVDKNDLTPFEEMRRIYQKSIVASVDIPADSEIKVEHLAFKKPGGGLSPAAYRDLLGRKTVRRIAQNAPIRGEDLQ